MFGKIVEKPVVIAFILLVIVGFFVSTTSLKRGNIYKGKFLDDILVEGHGLVFDIFIFGILIVVFNIIGEKKREIKRYKEEIDDYRIWEEKEATFRIAGNIKRLNRLGVTGINLKHCYLENAKLQRARFQKADFLEADLMGADLRETDFRGADLRGVNLKKTNLRLANLRGANLRGANLSGANLRGADLRSANLIGANISGANLRGADLNEADLRGADFRESDLLEANFGGANLKGADLQGTKNLNIEQLSLVKTLYKAILNEGLMRIITEKHPNLLERQDS